MPKKSSLIIDLRNVKPKSTEVPFPVRKNLTQHRTSDEVSLDNFNLVLEDEIIISSENFDTISIQSTPIPPIQFIPISAKKKYSQSYKRQKIQLSYQELVTHTRRTFSITRASTAIFLSICLFFAMSVPSLRTINRTLRIKDNVLLQASASERLLMQNSGEDLAQLSSTLTEISNGLNQSSTEISSLQGNLAGVLPLIPGLSVVDNTSDITKDVAQVIALSAQMSEALKPFVDQDINPFDTTKSITLVDGIQQIQSINRELVPALDQLHTRLNSFPLALIPGRNGDILRQLDKDLPQLKRILEQSDEYVNIFLNFVGKDMLRRYVFIFQNNQELRATGGFIGSFGLMNIDRGVVKSLDIQEIYNPDGQLLEQILAPEPLQEISPRWFLRDSNWFADFPTSAQKIISFYEKTGGVTPDGVISLTPTIIERLLTITGPIELEEYGVTITADNFVKLTQYQTGVAYDRVENKPKQFIADLAPILINKLLSADSRQYQKILEALNDSFQEKHIVLYFLDEQLQGKVEQYNLGGSLYETQKDYLSVVHSNIGGFKTDGVMEDAMNINTQIKDNGTIINTLTISRTHKGGDTEYEWWNQDNINYMRVYMPKGSRILSVKGYTDKEEKKPNDDIASFDQDVDLKAIQDTLVHNEDWDIDTFEETNKSVIGGWLITQPKQTSEVTIEYELPFTISSGDIYSLILQKQSGTIGSRYDYTIDISPKFKPIWRDSSFNLEQVDTKYQVKGEVLRTDEFIGMQFK